MPICIECCYPVSQLYHVLHSRNHKNAAPTSKPSISNLAGVANPQRATFHAQNPPESKFKTKNASGGGDVRLTQCPRCKRFADKYVEHDFVVLFIDLVLVKPQVYRHLLFNRLSRDDDELDPSILRLGILLILFDVYLTWSHIESLPPSFAAKSPIPTLNIFLQYLYYLFLCIVTTLSQHLTVRFLVGAFRLGNAADDERSSEGSPTKDSNTSTAPLPVPPRKPTPNAVSTALVVSSCMSIFPILTVVWKYGDAPKTSSAVESSSNSSSVAFTSGFLSGQGHGVDWVRRGVSWAVAVQNLEALRILLGCGYLGAGGVVAAGAAVRWTVRAAILGMAGLGEGG
ncbi:lipid intermediate transporter, partial [Lecanoromycetidae sp. Uapishka_2]